MTNDCPQAEPNCQRSIRPRLIRSAGGFQTGARQGYKEASCVLLCALRGPYVPPSGPSLPATKLPKINPSPPFVPFSLSGSALERNSQVRRAKVRTFFALNSALKLSLTPCGSTVRNTSSKSPPRNLL